MKFKKHYEIYEHGVVAPLVSLSCVRVCAWHDIYSNFWQPTHRTWGKLCVAPTCGILCVCVMYIMCLNNAYHVFAWCILCVCILCIMSHVLTWYAWGIWCLWIISAVDSWSCSASCGCFVYSIMYVLWHLVSIHVFRTACDYTWGCSIGASCSLCLCQRRAKWVLKFHSNALIRARAHTHKRPHGYYW